MLQDVTSSRAVTGGDVPCDDGRVSDQDRDSAPEKRGYRRYTLFFPVTLRVGTVDHAGEEEVVGVCRDASAGGVLVAAATPLEPGASVVARLRISSDLRDERTIEGTIVRQELSDGEMRLAFPYSIAVEFLEPAPDLPELLEQIAGAREGAPTPKEEP